MGEDLSKIYIENLHRAMIHAQRNMRKAKDTRNRYANQDAREPNLEVGQAVMLKNNARTDKLDSHYKAYFRIIEHKSPVAFKIKNVVDGSTQTVHARNIKAIDTEHWKLPKYRLPPNDRRRKATYVVPPEDSNSPGSDDDDNLMGQMRPMHAKNRDDSSGSDIDVPLSELRRQIRNRHINERSDSLDSDDDIPLAELKRKYRRQRNRLEQPTDADMDIGHVRRKATVTNILPYLETSV